MTDKKLAVFFPGIGYGFDRPLLHFGIHAAVRDGYEILKVGYSGFPPKIIGNADRMKESIGIAKQQSEEILKDVPFDDYSRIVFVSKSIGTVVAPHYAAEHGLKVDEILFTPFPETFRIPMTGKVIAFHGTGDQWMQNEEVIRTAAEAGIRMALFEGGNHSLETGDVKTDIKILEQVFKEVVPFLSEN